MSISLEDLKTAKDVTALVKQAVETFIALFNKFGWGKPGGKKGHYKPRKGDLVNTVLLIGMEGTGKTELIRSCFGHPNADSSKETEDFELYTSEQTVNGKNRWINVADYMGHNIGMLVSSFIDIQRQPDSPLKYGQIHSVVLMVDLRYPEEDRAISAPTAPSADQKRIKANVEQWNEMAVDAIFGLLTEPALSYICIFINKYDLISEPKKFSKAKAEKSYANLAQYLELKVKPIKAGGKTRVDVIVGSAKHGDGHSELMAKLYQYSAPVS